MNGKFGNDFGGYMFVIKTNKDYRINFDIICATWALLFFGAAIFLPKAVIDEFSGGIDIKGILSVLLITIICLPGMFFAWELMIKELHHRFDQMIFCDDGIQIKTFPWKKYYFNAKDIKHVEYDDSYCIIKGINTDAMFLCMEGNEKYEFPIYKEVHNNYNRACIWMNQHNIEVVKKHTLVSDFSIREFRENKEIKITTPRNIKKDYRSCEMKSKSAFAILKNIKINRKSFVKIIPFFLFCVLSPTMRYRTVRTLSRAFFVKSITEFIINIFVLLIGMLIGIGVILLIYIFFKLITKKRIRLEKNVISIKKHFFIKEYKLEDVKHIQYEENKQISYVITVKQLRFEINGREYRFNDWYYDNFGNFVSFLMKRAEVELVQ